MSPSSTSETNFIKLEYFLLFFLSNTVIFDLLKTTLKFSFSIKLFFVQFTKFFGFVISITLIDLKDKGSKK